MMVDTEHVLEQMRAANPAPSLEQLPADDLDLVHTIVARERSATTTPMTEQPPTRPDLLTLRRGMRPVLVAGLAFILVLGTLGAALLLFRGFDETATEGFVCPPGSTPDQPGPANQTRPPLDNSGFTTFHPGSGRALHLAGDGLWMFDVCTNTWTTAPGPDGIGAPMDFVYDVDSERAIAFGYHDDEVAQVWAYEPETQTWTRKKDLVSPTPRDFLLWLTAVYDPVTGLVAVREFETAAMWTYDVDTDTWTEVDQGWPRPEFDGEMFLTYDASVERLIEYHPWHSTWEFDLRAGRWEEHTTNTPEIQGFGWWPTGQQFVYDEANQVSAFFHNDGVTTYDAAEHRWNGRSEVEEAGGPYAEYRNLDGFSTGWTYDSVNRRILAVGTGWRDTRELERLENETAERDRWRIWEMTGGVFAFDVATGEWITLLEPTVGGAEPTATAGLTCPPGSTPDQPGPAHRHPRVGSTTFDPGSGRVLMLGREGLWMFDVCVNTWTLAPGPEGINGKFVYDVDSDRAIVFDSEEEGVARVWTYEPDGQTWTEMSRFAVGPPPEWFFPSFPHFQAAYDPVTGLVVVREIFTSQMWTYDVDTDTWTEIDQGTILPPAVAEDGPHVELLTYDASVDRLIMYVASDDAAVFVLGTWEFDLRAGRWEEQQTNTPAHPGLGWWPTGEAFVYDEANEVSVLFAEAYLASYDASEHSWTVIPHDSDTVGGTAVSITYDTVNERILVAGRFAYDVATTEWTPLVEPTTE